MTAWSSSGRPKASRGTPSLGAAALGEGDPGPAQGAHGGGVAAALGRPVAAEPEHVRPGPQPQPVQLGAAAQLPGRADELGHMRRQPVQVLQVVGIGQAPVEADAEALGGLGRVLGDVAGHLLRRSAPQPVVTGVMLRTSSCSPQRAYRSGPPSSRGGQGTRTAGTACRRASSRRAAVNGLGGWGQAARTATVSGRVQADDGVEVDRPTALELGHLGIGDPDQPAQLTLLEADQPAQGAVDGDGGPPPQLRGQGVPEHLGLGVIAAGTQRLAQPRVVLVMAVPAASPVAMGQRAPWRYG